MLTDNRVIALFAAATFLLHVAAANRYGYFVDELYYLACSQHLAWGYVDQPPLIALVTWLVRHTLGSSLVALRILPALAGAAIVALAGLVARALGGGRYAQLLACLCTMAAPGILIGDGLLTMNAFEPLFWMGCAYLLIHILRGGDQRLWLAFGTLAGLGVENKYSMLIFGGGLVLGLLAGGQARLFRTRWIWIGAGIACLIVLPNLVWNIRHHFPFLELQANIHASGRDVALSPWAFFAEETLTLLPLTLPVWLGGLWFLLFGKAARDVRALGIAWLFTAAVIVTLSPRIYYLYPAMPLLFAAGGVAWEDWLAGRSIVKTAYPVLIALSGVLLAPLAVPLLSPENYIRYTAALHLEQPRIENHRLGPLPQIYADQFGWDEMAASVARVYNALPKNVRARTAIFGQNYGEAGAIDFFGPKYGLPPAISGHQNYFLWGPRGFTGESLIVMDASIEDLSRPDRCARVRKVADVTHPYSMPYRHFGLYYCQGIRGGLAKLWPKVKKWD